MSMIDDLKRGGLATLALGAGVLSLLPAVLPVAARGLRPLVNSAIQGTLVCLEKGREAVAEIHRQLDQAAAEAEAAARAGHGAGSGTAAGAGAHAAGAHAPYPRPPAGTPETKPLMAANGEPDPEVMG